MQDVTKQNMQAKSRGEKKEIKIQKCYFNNKTQQL